MEVSWLEKQRPPGEEELVETFKSEYHKELP